MTELRLALRQLRKRPGFALIVILTLALGIGVNTAMFSVVNGVLLRPLPFPDSDRLATVWLTYPHWREREVLRQFWDAIPLSYPEYERLRGGTTALEAVSIYRTDRMALTGFDRPAMVAVGSADDALPDVLRAGPAIGRWFSRAEAAPGGTRLAVLSHGFWHTWLGGDRAALGRTIRLDGDAYTVVGILPDDFRYTRPNQTAVPDVWIPVGALSFPLDEDNHVFDAVARLAPGVTLAHAETETARLLRGERSPESRGARVVSRKEQEIAGVRPVLHVLWGAVGLILVIACVNVATLLLGRMAERERELVVRHALGAGRRRLARHVFVESVLLAAIGGAAGVLIAWWGTGAVTAFLPDTLPRLHEVRVDGTVLAFSLGVTLLAAALAGTLPAVLSGLRAPQAALRRDAPQLTGRGRLQRSLVAVQLALALVLLVGGGLLSRTVLRLWSVDTGIRRESVLTFGMSIPATGYPEDSDQDAFYRELVDRLAALPGVDAAASTSVLPFSGASESSSIWPASWGPEEGAKPELERRIVTPDFHRALGIPLVRGRMFAFTDDTDAAPVMLVSRAAAERLWEAGDPIGERVQWNEQWWTVVGVVGDVRDRGPGIAPEALFYVPAAQVPTAARWVLVRASVPPLALADPVRAVVRDLDPSVPVTDLRPMTQVAASAVAAEQFRAFLIGGLALLAALLAAVGLYGVMHQGVVRRTREIGIRMALGAERRRVLRLVLRQAVVTIGVGLAAGLLIAVPASRALEAFLFGVRPVDLPTYLAVVALMAAVALVAALKPAWRATRIDPMEALRHE